MKRRRAVGPGFFIRRAYGAGGRTLDLDEGATEETGATFAPLDVRGPTSGDDYDGQPSHLTLDHNNKMPSHEGSRTAAGSLGQQLNQLKPALAQAAQVVLDAWQPGEDGDEVYGSGGPCDDIAQAMSGVISSLDCEVREGGQEGDDHAFLQVYNDVEAYNVDIPPGAYEVGGGYSWRKLEGVVLGADDVVVEEFPRRWVEAQVVQLPSGLAEVIAEWYAYAKQELPPKRKSMSLGPLGKPKIGNGIWSKDAVEVTLPSARFEWPYGIDGKQLDDFRVTIYGSRSTSGNAPSGTTIAGVYRLPGEGSMPTMVMRVKSESTVRLVGIIEHELQHVVQDVMQSQKKLRGGGGLPTKSKYDDLMWAPNAEQLAEVYPYLTQAREDFLKQKKPGPPVAFLEAIPRYQIFKQKHPDLWPQVVNRFLRELDRARPMVDPLAAKTAGGFSMDDFEWAETPSGSDAPVHSELKKGDSFKVDGKGPTWIVEVSHGASGWLRRDGQKKWFGYLYGGGAIEIYPMTQGSGERTGPNVAAGKPVLNPREARELPVQGDVEISAFTENLHSLDEGIEDSPYSQPDEWVKSYPDGVHMGSIRVAQAEGGRPPWLAVDLDGTLLSSADASRGEFGRPLPGAADALRELKSLGWRVSIYTARLQDLDEDTAAVEAARIAKTLRQYGLDFSDVWVGRKPRADVFVDDRAVAFKGDWKQTLLELVSSGHGHRQGGALIDSADGELNSEFEDVVHLRHDRSIPRPPEEEELLY